MDTIATAQQAVDKLIADRPYAIAVAVENNYAQALRNYQRARMTTEAPGVGSLAEKLITLNQSGYGVGGFAAQVDDIVNNVPWVFGRNDMMDEAYHKVKAIYEGNAEDVDTDKFLPFIVAGIAGITQAISTIAGGQFAADAAEAEQERLAQLAELERQKEENRAAAFKRTAIGVGIGLAVVTAILVVVYFIRRKRNAA